jgi:undecaprenyl-diphosphatase
MEKVNDAINDTVKEVQQEIQAARRPWYHVLRRARFLLGLYLVLLALFSSLALLVYIHPLLPVDIAITREIQEKPSPLLTSFMLAVSYLGNTPWLFTGLIALAVVVFWFLRLRLEAIVIAFVNLSSSLLNILVKSLVHRPRPTRSLVDVFLQASGYDFPSGHVMSYVAFWGLLFIFVLILWRGKSWWRLSLLGISALFVILVGPSRIYLGDHWASDVVGAYLLEGLWLWACLWVYTKLKERRVLSSPAHRVIPPDEQRKSDERA